MLHSKLKIALMVIALLPVAACSSSSSSTDSAEPIVLLSDSQVLTWNSDLCMNIWAGSQVFDTLVRMDTTGSPSDGMGEGLAPGLAESWEYDDATATYTFHLVEDAAFSNGQPLTADDIVFSVGVWKSGESYGMLYDFIESATAIDEHTVTITMTGPNSDLPSQLTWCNSAVLPKDFAGLSAEEFWASPIGAGPYAVESSEDLGGPTETITLVKNEHYVGPDGSGDYADEVILKYIEDPNLRLLEYQSGNADVIMSLDESQYEQVPADEVIETEVQASSSLVVNTVDGPLSDVRIRTAISKALDRTALAAVVPGAIPAQGPLAPNVPGTQLPDADLEYAPSAEVDEASEALSGTAFASGGTVSLTYDSSSQEDETVAQLIQGQLADINITVELDPLDSAALQDSRNEGEFDILISSGSAYSPWVTERINVLVAYIYPWAGSDTAHLQEQLGIAQASQDKTVIEGAARTVANLTVEDAVFVTLLYRPYLYAVSKDIEGFAPNQYTMWYGDTLRRSSTAD